MDETQAAADIATQFTGILRGFGFSGTTAGLVIVFLARYAKQIQVRLERAEQRLETTYRLEKEGVEVLIALGMAGGIDVAELQAEAIVAEREATQVGPAIPD